MIGIYQITNKLNGKFYIGQSNDIQRRFTEHCQKGASSRIPLDLAIQKYGQENFDFIVLEECFLEDLNKRETFWILNKDAIKKGYNCNIGGDNSQQGENNSNAKLTEKDVYFIRNCYNQHKKQKEIYEEYFSDKITFQSFQNIWQGQSWKTIMPEVFTQENKDYYKYFNSLGANSKKSQFTDEEVLTIRTRYIKETALEIYKDYKNRVKFQTFQAILWGRTYKNIPIYSKKTKQWIK